MQALHCGERRHPLRIGPVLFLGTRASARVCFVTTFLFCRCRCLLVRSLSSSTTADYCCCFFRTEASDRFCCFAVSLFFFLFFVVFVVVAQLLAHPFLFVCFSPALSLSLSLCYRARFSRACAFVCVRVQEQMIRHAGSRKARGVEGSGVEGRGGRRRSRSFAGPGGSPRVSASSPSQQGGSTGAASAGKRKRSPSIVVSSGTGVGSSSEARMEKGEKGVAAAAAAAAAEEQEDEEAAAERERQAEEEREAEVSAARPALVFCRVVDAMQSALKPRQDVAVAAAAAATGGQEATVLEIFLSGGDDLLLAASRAAHEAYERAIRPVGSGGGVVEVLRAMGLERAFARWAWRGEERKEKGGKGKQRGEKEVASACRERVMNLLCEGDLLAVAGYRTSA